MTRCSQSSPVDINSYQGSYKRVGKKTAPTTEAIAFFYNLPRETPRIVNAPTREYNKVNEKIFLAGEEMRAVDAEKYFDILREDRRDSERRHSESMSLIRDEMQRLDAKIDKLDVKIDAEISKLEIKIDKNISETKESRKYFWALTIPTVIALASLVVQIMEKMG